MTVPSLALAQSAMKFTSPIFLVALYLASSKVFAAALPVDIAGPIDLVPRQGVGSTITVGGKQYRLIREVSGEGGAATFQAQAVVGGGTFYAKRPTRVNPPSQAFTNEVTNTQKASQALGTNIFVASGSNLNYTWMITAPAPGGEIWLRWNANKNVFKRRAACEADMTTARTVIVRQNQRLATGAGFVHGDNHPGNWYVPSTGTITTAVPIDFGLVRPPPPATNIETLVRDQYVYNADMWSFFASNGFCT